MSEFKISMKFFVNENLKDFVTLILASMELYASGRNGRCQLGIKNQSKSRWLFVSKNVKTATLVPFDLTGVQSVSCGHGHSVITKEGRVFVAGKNDDYRIGGDDEMYSNGFTEIKISDEPIVWAECGNYYTIYLTESGKVIHCGKSNKGKRIVIPLETRVIAVCATHEFCYAIDEEGGFYFINYYESPYSSCRIYLGAPAIEIASCLCSTFVLTADGRVYSDSDLSKTHDFEEVESLRGLDIVKINGYFGTCAALTSDGRVFMYGNNFFGQLGNDESSENGNDDFEEIRFDEKIKDIGCSMHTIFITESDKIYGCGQNHCCQLLKKTWSKSIHAPEYITTKRTANVFVGNGLTFILSGSKKLENPAKKRFYQLHQQVQNNGLIGEFIPKPKKKDNDQILNVQNDRKHQKSNQNEATVSIPEIKQSKGHNTHQTEKEKL